jgi:hypothetical protein
VADDDGRPDRNPLAVEELLTRSAAAEVLENQQGETRQEERLVALSQAPNCPLPAQEVQVHLFTPFLYRGRTVVARGTMRRNKRLQQVIIWVVVLGMVLTLAAGILSVAGV